MEREKSPLLHEPDLMLAVLRVAASGQGTIDGCIEQLRGCGAARGSATACPRPGCAPASRRSAPSSSGRG